MKHLFFITSLLTLSAFAGTFQPITFDTLQEECLFHNISFIEYTFVDFLGNRKAITRPVEYLQEDFENPLTIDGSSIIGCNRITNSDLLLKPDFNARFITPWTLYESPTMRIMCTMQDTNKQPIASDSRSQLIKVMQEASDLGYEFLVGPEIEFYLFNENTTNYDIGDQQTYCDAAQPREFEIAPMILTLLNKGGIQVERAHHEVGPGQYEVSLHYDNALKIADQIIIAKDYLTYGAMLLHKNINFLPKPIKTLPGSGMHIHFSLRDKITGNNIFSDSVNQEKLSSLAQSFIAGILNRVDQIMVLLNPTENSYERLVPGFEAPVYVCAGYKNRSALIRIPHVQPQQPQAVRAEIRCPDCQCNPYLTFAALLKAGLLGIKNQEQLTHLVQDNVYELSKKELEQQNIKVLPTSLEEAIKCCLNGNFLPELLGPEFYPTFMDFKFNELRQPKGIPIIF